MKLGRRELTALGEMKENRVRFSPGTNVPIYIYIYICVCVHVCVGVREVTTLLAGG